MTADINAAVNNMCNYSEYIVERTREEEQAKHHAEMAAKDAALADKDAALMAIQAELARIKAQYGIAQ